MKKDIYIIKNSVNNKVYIGQAKNSAERWLSHIYNARYEGKKDKSVQVIHKAMMKYGVDKFHYEILEFQIENYDEREIYWISKYNSLVPNGYNVAIGGNGTGSGIHSTNSVFNSEEELLKCISEISATEKTFVNIARKYNCSPEVILAINEGKRYKQENLIYPLRGKHKYTDSLVKQIRYSLKYELDLSIRDIAKKYSIDVSQVSCINNGKIYFLSCEKYPLRNKRVKDLDSSVVTDIIEDIKLSELPMCEIAKKHNISRATLSSINKGVYYKMDGIIYPIRNENDTRNKSTKRFFDIDEIKEIHSLLESGVSNEEIAKKYFVTKATIQNINNGKTKKYVLSGYKYPIRKK